MANRIKLTSVKKAAFIETLRENGGDATRAARKHRITRTCLYDHRKKDADFDKAWTEAVIESTAALEDEAVHRAITGKSDTMLIFTLKARRPDVYRESFKHEHGGPNGGPIETKIEAKTTTQVEVVIGDKYRDAFIRALSRCADAGVGAACDGGEVDPARADTKAG